MMANKTDSISPFTYFTKAMVYPPKAIVYLGDSDKKGAITEQLRNAPIWILYHNTLKDSFILQGPVPEFQNIELLVKEKAMRYCVFRSLPSIGLNQNDIFEYIENYFMGNE